MARTPATTPPKPRASRRSKPPASEIPAGQLPATSPRFDAASYANAKASRVGALLQVGGVGQPAWSPRRYDSFALEAYVLNIVANVCITKRTRAIAALPLMVEAGGTRTAEHPVLQLLRRPNPMQQQTRFLRAVTTFSAIAGNSFVEAVGAKGRPPRELWCLRPDRVTILEGATGLPFGYRYETPRGRVDFPVDQLTGRSDLLHLREFHPLNDWYGLAETEPAGRSIDQFNAASSHNAALLQNGVRPSGFLVIKTAASPEQLERAQAVIADKWAGTENAGKAQVLGGDWDWIAAGQTIKDMEFWEGIQQRTREICAAYGVPHVLVVPGEATYSNRDQAYLELYEATVLPEADVLLADLTSWLQGWFPGRWKLTYDKDQIWALTPRRVEHRKQVVLEFEKQLITRDEAREALQYEPAEEGGDEYFGQAAREAQAAAAAAGQQAGPAGPSGPARKPGGSKGAPRPFEAAGGAVGAAKAIDPDDAAGDLPDDALVAATRPVMQEIIAAAGQQVFEELAVDISFDLLDPRVTGYLDVWGATRIRQLVGTTTRQLLADTLSEGVAKGESTAKLVERVRATFTAAGAERAQKIAETEVTNASGFAGQMAMEDAGVAFKVWMATMDSHTRDTHRTLDGQIQPTGEPFLSPSGAKGMHPGGFGVGSEDIYCFPGDTTIRSLGAINRVYRRWYEGALVKITTASGRKLTATPNHPILSEAGLVPAGRLNVGDNLVCNGRPVGDGTSNPDPKHAPASLAEVFRLALMSGVGQRVAGIRPQFHGDGRKGDVDVVTLHGELLFDGVSEIPDSGRQLVLSPSPVGKAGLSGFSTALAHGEIVNGAASRGVGGRSECPSRFRVHPGHSGEHRPAATTGLDAEMPGYAAHRASLKPERSGDGQFALAGAVAVPDHREAYAVGQPGHCKGRAGGPVTAIHAGPAQTNFPEGRRAAQLLHDLGDTGAFSEQLDPIVNLTVEPDFAGHVFTLETATGLFAAEGVITGNCRCASGPFIPGIDGPLPDHLRQRFGLDEDGEPIQPKRRGRRLPSLAKRRKARVELRPNLEAKLVRALRAGFAEQEVYVIRRLRRLGMMVEAGNYQPLFVKRGSHWLRQPRVPAGAPTGGQWTDGIAPLGGGGGLADPNSAPQWSDDLIPLGPETPFYGPANPALQPKPLDPEVDAAYPPQDQSFPDYFDSGPGNYMDESEAIHRATGIRIPPMPQDGLAAVGDYTGSMYESVNYHLRGKPHNYMTPQQLADSSRSTIAGLDSMMAHATVNETIITARGLGNTVRKQLENAAPGTVFGEPGYGSSSTSLSIARSFAKKYTRDDGREVIPVLQVQIPKGMRAMSVRGHSSVSSEDEILLPRNTKMRLDGTATHTAGKYGVMYQVFYATVIEQGPP